MNLYDLTEGKGKKKSANGKDDYVKVKENFEIVYEKINEAQDAWHGEQTDEWHGGGTDNWHGQGDAWHSVEEAAPDTATLDKVQKKPAVPNRERDPGAFATRSHIRDMEQRHTAWDRIQQELEDEFYARHPELDDRNKAVEEDNDLAGALTGLSGVAATTAPENNLSPVGSGTVDEELEHEVGFSVDSEAAYRAVMSRFGDSIEHRADGVMYAPRELWSAIEQVAFDADGVGAEEDAGLDMAEDQHSDFGGEDSIRVWENIDDRLDMEEKMSIFESWSRGQLNESADEHKLEYFRSLEHYSSNPVVGKTYIVVPLALSHQLRALSVPEKCKYLGFKNHMHLVENQVGDVKKYPYAPFRPNSSFICFFFDSINKYNQFRSSISVKFNLSLSDINEELNTGGSNQEPASDSTSPVGGVAEGSLNEFAPDGFNDGEDPFDPDTAQDAYDDGVRKGVSLSDNVDLARAMAINYWHMRNNGLYKQYFAKGFKVGREDKIQWANTNYGTNLKLMKDGSIRRDEQGVAEGSLELEEQFDIIESMIEYWAEQHNVDSEVIWEDLESVDDEELLSEAEAWQTSKGKNKNGGLNKKGVSSYRHSHPGSHLQTAVTTKPSKLKKGSKASKRRKSFCARMKGMKKHRTGAKTKHDPNSRINKSLRKWHCE